MAGVPYPERFILHTAQGYSNPYTVPIGKRAVLASFVSTNNAGAAQQAILQVVGNTIWFASVPGPGCLQSAPFKLVVYSGETFRIWHQGGAQVSAISGSLLDDPP